jgi:DNA-binding MurR/RpiR family transcriptional regulator
MLGKRCILLDPSGGLATYMASSAKSTDVLLAVSFRFHAIVVVNVVEQAAAKRIPIVAISDRPLSGELTHMPVSGLCQSSQTEPEDSGGCARNALPLPSIPT